MLTGVSAMPNCRSDGKINLLEYSYHQMDCPLASECVSVSEELLLPEEILLLHEECSMREACTTLKFSTRFNALGNKINAMNIKYQCIGQRSTFVDICEKRIMYFNNTLHLCLVIILKIAHPVVAG